MRAAILAAALTAVLPGHAKADCAEVGEAIAARANAQILEMTPQMGNIIFSHPAAKEMRLLCGPGPNPALSLTYEGKPDARFLALASVAGGFVAGGPHVSIKAIADCILAAAIDPSGSAEREAGRAHLDCWADVPDSVGVVTIDLRQD